MSCTFLLTADWQLGKPFATIGDEPKWRHRIQQERLHAAQRMKDEVEKSGASFVGDVFSSSQATEPVSELFVGRMN
jgi:hypothetical protein